MMLDSFCLDAVVLMLASQLQTCVTNVSAKNTHFRSALNRIDFISDATKNNVEQTTWAFQVVSTRSFETDNGDRRIVPMADMVRRMDRPRHATVLSAAC